MPKSEEERCCGSCAWFKHEDLMGWGICYHKSVGYLESSRNCSMKPCKYFVSEAEFRHLIAVLIQANRYRRDNEVPAIYKMPNPKELGLAIDFAVEYMKTFSKI